MRAVACQLRSTGDVAVNRKAAAEAVTIAAEAGAALVVLPEAAQCAFGGPRTDIRSSAEPLDGPFVTALVETLGRAGTPTTVVAGMFEPAGPERVHNTLVVLDRRGVAGTYRKLHLYDALGWRESERVEAGENAADGLLVVPVGEHRVGVMTCYDLRFPEVARALAVRGATVLAVPAAWVAGPGKGEQWRVLLQARAIEETCYAVGADQPGPEMTGLSAVVNPRGHVMTSLDEMAEGSVTAELDLDEVAAVRAVLPLLEGRRFDVVPRGEGQPRFGNEREDVGARSGT